MSRSRDLANLAGDATGLETLTVSDITDLTATATELNYVDGVSSALQTQINSKIGGSNPVVTLGSNTTFPSGHTVQTKFTQIQKAISATTSTSFIEVDSDLRINFTPVSASNKLVFIFHAGNAIAQSSDLQIRIMFNTSSDTLPDSNFSGSATSSLRQGNQEVTQVHHFTRVDSYSGTRCISPMFSSSNGNSVNISNSTKTTFFMIQEVIP